MYLKSNFSLILFVLFLFGCSSEKNLTIKMAQEHGFSPDKELDYQVLNALDGWSGEWGEDYVELYQFNNERLATTVAEQMFQQLKIKNARRKLCASYNLVLVSQTGAGCIKLKEFSNPEWHLVIPAVKK